jgi:hypothetical protein
MDGERASYDKARDVPPIVNDVLNSPGCPLDATTRTQMEPRFGHDFSHVRVHTDGKAAKSTRAVNAVAYTVKQDIAFDAGKYAPQNNDGQELLVHELAHVVQQSRGIALSPSNSLNSSSERSAEQTASDFFQGSGTIRISGASAPGLARQKNTDAPKPAPTTNFSTTQQAGRTIVTLNGVAIAESSDVLPADVELRAQWTPEMLTIGIVIPEGKTIFIIPGLNTNVALLQLSSHFFVKILERSKVPERSLNELGGVGPLHELQTIDTLTGARPKGAPAKKAGVPPQAPPKSAVAPKQTQPDATASSETTPPFQFFRTPPVDLNLSPSAKYGKPKTDKEIVQDRINKIITDAMAGRSDIPPLPKGIEPTSVIEAIKKGVAEAVKPLLAGLPKDVRDFITEKIVSAVDEGIEGLVDSALDATTLDAKAKAAIKNAIEAGIHLKPSQPKTEDDKPSASPR